MRRYALVISPPIVIAIYIFMLLRDKDTSFRDFTPVFWGLLAWSIACDAERRRDAADERRRLHEAARAAHEAQEQGAGGGIPWAAQARR